MKRVVLICALLMTAITDAAAQVPTCSEDVPYYTVDFTGNPAGSWISPGHSRFGNCCGTVFPDRCTSFEIICDSNTAMIMFEIASGAIPSGSMFYQINCGPQVPVGDAICVSGPNPHYLTFCKPGNNTNTYRVTSISRPVFPKDDTTRIGCSLPIPTLGMEEETVTWNSIFPGAPGDYNSYLNCTSNCDSALYTPAADAPPYVEYVICGTPIATDCGFIFACDTVRIYNMPALSGSASPNPGGFCVGSLGITINATASGGFGPYSFIWRDQSLDQVCNTSSCFLSNAGIYSIEIRDILYDSTYCPAAFTTATVIVTPPPVVNAGPDQTLCPTNAVVILNGSMLNSATGIWSGGAGTFNPGATSLLTAYTPTPAEIASGQVTLTLTSTGAGGGCEDESDQVTIHFPPTMVVSVSNINVNCFGETDAINASVSGGIGQYTYQWATGQNTTSITAGQGTYCVVVTDILGCTATDCGTISAPPTLYIAMSATPCSVNGGSDGTASTIVTGGTPPYTYAWSTGGTNSTISGLSYGIYTVTATDANGCTIISSVVVNEPRCNGFYASASGNDISCFGDNDGSATASPNSGTPPYSYSWNPSGQTTATASSLTSGVHQCIITDVNGCMASVNVSLTQPAPMINTMTHTNVSTVGGNDGSAATNVSGGTPSYTYAWSTGATTSSVSSLSAGTYSVTITDANNCTLTDNVQINQPPCSNLIAGVASTNVSCSGGNNGSATAVVIMGADPISYLWSTGVTTSSISGLTAGNYNLAITDGIGCTTFVNFTIIEPSPLSIALSPTDIRCATTNDGTIELTVTGGTFPFTYAWSNGMPTEDLIDLSNGSYSVTVTDAHGCTTTGSASVTRPPLLIASAIASNVSCTGEEDGSIDASVSGGISPYTYNWSNNATTQDISGLSPGEYLLVVTDANNCSTSALSSLVDEPDTISIVSVIADCPLPGTGMALVHLGATGGNPGAYQFSVDGGDSFLAPGVNSVMLPVDSTYTIIVQDATGCPGSDSFTLSIAPEPEITAVAFASCIPDGATSIPVTISVTGGSGGAMQASFDNGVTWLAPGVYTTNLPTGDTYIIIVRDSSGCVSAVVNIELATDLVIDGSILSGPLCTDDNNGSIDLNVHGGTARYSYAWSNGATTQDITNVGAGTYIVTVTDANDCIATDTFYLADPLLLITTISSPVTSSGFNVSHYGMSDGSIDLTVEGGTPPYTYQWSNGATSQDLSGLAAGTYSVTITDANGCQATEVITLTSPLILEMPTGFSPNGDGLNDFFEVHGIEAYPNNNIEIYNRWGNLVWDASNYMNKWNGTNETGDELPDGTYFVILNINDGEIILKGYVDIRR